LKYFFLAGEASGDKQAALLCHAIKQHDADAVIEGWGGDEMIAQGVSITKHYRELAFMGFVEVIKHLPAIMRNFKSCKKEILAFRPDALVLVDYPGFNLRMAAWAFKQNIPVYYYISPQLWAWHTSRVHGIKKAVRKMYVILPFEKEFYARYGINAMYIGHPLAMSKKQQGEFSIHEKQIALLPGSRMHEVEMILPEMVEAAGLLPDYQLQVVAVNHLPLRLYTDIIEDTPNISIAQKDMYVTLKESIAAVVTSGTATLETALAGTPQVVVYKGNPFSYEVAKRLIQVPYISLVNLIATKELVPELIQRDCSARNIARRLKQMIDPEENLRIRNEYKLLTEQLTNGGGPDAAAADIISDLRSRNNH
jgi:lipid-A-disaccharide synthase